MPNEPKSVAEFAAEHRDLNPTWDPAAQPYVMGIDPAVETTIFAMPMSRRSSAQDPASAAAWRDRFIAGIASSLGLPYSAFVEDMGWSVYDDPRMKTVKALIRRAACGASEGRCGWHRKLKRARRIQREVCGDRTSNAWFSLQWDEARRIAHRGGLARWQNHIYHAYLAETVSAKRIVMPVGWKPPAWFNPEKRGG